MIVTLDDNFILDYPVNDFILPPPPLPPTNQTLKLILSHPRFWSEAWNFLTHRKLPPPDIWSFILFKSYGGGTIPVTAARAPCCSSCACVWVCCRLYTNLITRPSGLQTIRVVVPFATSAPRGDYGELDSSLTKPQPCFPPSDKFLETHPSVDPCGEMPEQFPLVFTPDSEPSFLSLEENCFKKLIPLSEIKNIEN